MMQRSPTERLITASAAQRDAALARLAAAESWNARAAALLRDWTHYGDSVYRQRQALALLAERDAGDPKNGEQGNEH